MSISTWQIKKDHENPQIIHVNGALAKATDNRHNDGSLDLELVIQSNTQVTKLGKHKLIATDIETFSLSDIAQARKHTISKKFE